MPEPITSVEDAARLHRLGYTTRAVHAHWCLEAFAVLCEHLADGGQPLTDDGSCDPSHLLSATEWRRVNEAARVITDLAPIIAGGLELGPDFDAAPPRTGRDA